MCSFRFLCIFVVTLIWITEVKCLDPCSESVYQIIGGEDKRSPDYELDLSADLAFSDDRLPHPSKWFRITNDAGEKMPTSAPGAFHCGTWYPIWLNGQLPEISDETVSRRVCLQTYANSCDRTWNIDIRRCSGNYLVYRLEKSPIIDSAYCFGKSTLCPEGTSSETGYAPNCSSNFPSLSIHPVVKPKRMKGTEYIPEPVNAYNVEPVFECQFDNPGTLYYYDIQWYINEISLKTDTDKLYGHEDTILKPRHWESSFDMNMLVKCSVRVKNSVGSTPSPRMYSADFIAGIVTDKYQYEVEEGNYTVIKVRATVPLSCNIEHFLHKCKETIRLSYPYEDSCQPTSTVGNILVEEQCGADIQADDWDAEHALKVYGYIDNMYNIESVRYATLSLTKANSVDASKAWDNLKIPDFNIFISDGDPQLSGRYCYSSSDPSYYTFDGRWYSAQISGEHVLYKHKREPYSVHTLTSGCYWGSCNVGIAIRSHDSLLVVRTVDKLYNPIKSKNDDDNFSASFTSRTYPMIDMRDCDDKNLRVSRIKKEFTVTFPSGTEVFFRIKFDQSSYHNLLVVNNINIKPSILDIQQTDGLCGNFNFDNQDEFTDKIEFLNSWAISNESSESLFSESPNFVNDQFFKKPFCECGKQAPGKVPIGSEYNEVHCNLTQPREQCYNTERTSGALYFSSCSGQRKRRDTEIADDIVDKTPLRYADGFQERYIPVEPKWRNGFNENLARNACLNGFNDVTAINTCKEYANLKIDNFIESCITDVKATGGITLLENTIATMISSCITEVSRNETLMTTNSTNSSDTTSDTEPAFTLSLLDEIKSKLCINNCSNNGICDKKGFCNCYPGFIGEQCSIVKSLPPKRVSIPGKGLCGTTSRSCSKTVINGIFESETIWCKLIPFKIINNEKQVFQTSVIVEGEYHDFSSISCSLESSSRRKKRSTTIPSIEGYQISLSYDGTNFGDEVSIMVFDDSCYSCNSTTLTCVLLDSCPLITTTESNDNTEPPTKNNEIEVTTKTTITTESTAAISKPTDPSKTTNYSGGSNIMPIVGGFIGLALLLIILVCVYVLLKKKSKERATCEDHCELNVPPNNTSMPFRRESSFLSLDAEWLDQRCPTPELFVASGYK